MKQKILKLLRAMQKFALHPIVIFVVLQIVSVSLTVLWVMWYVNQSSLKFVNTYDVAFLITGCVLTGIILLGTVVLFVFAIKQSRLNKQQRAFVSTVTHELRSPLASIQLSLETLTGRQLSPDNLDRLYSMMRIDLDRLMNLVDQILVSARLDRGIKMFEAIEIFCLREVIEESGKHAQHLDQGAIERLQVNCDPKIEIMSSRGAIALVFNNLIENAIKYSAKGSRVLIEVVEAQDQLEIRFSDTGFGIDKSEQKKIFKMFSRGELAHKRAIPGTGLGLFIVKSILDVLGGKIFVTSLGRGLGSTFTVVLPKKGTT